jgi:hypothetical protein
MSKVGMMGTIYPCHVEAALKICQRRGIHRDDVILEMGLVALHLLLDDLEIALL